MKLGKFIQKKILLAILVLIGLSILIFTIARVIPGDPVRLALGPRAPKEVVNRVREEMHLDKPIYMQYLIWIKNVLQGDFGRSLYTRQAVVEDLKKFFPATFELALIAGLIMVIMSILLGSIAGHFRNTWIDNFLRLFAYAGVVTPSFVFAILFVLCFGYAIQIFPIAGRLSAGISPPQVITGMITIDSLLTGQFTTFLNALWHIILPALSLTMNGMAQQARITRASICDNYQKDYILAHKSYGISERTILFKFLLKPSLIPPVSIMGASFASLLANAFLVELVFNWPGMSRYGMNAILRKDLNAIIAVILILGIVFVVGNIIVDIIVVYLDPRIRMGRGN